MISQNIRKIQFANLEPGSRNLVTTESARGLEGSSLVIEYKTRLQALFSRRSGRLTDYLYERNSRTLPWHLPRRICV